MDLIDSMKIQARHSNLQTVTVNVKQWTLAIRLGNYSIWNENKNMITKNYKKKS